MACRGFFLYLAVILISVRVLTDLKRRSSDEAQIVIGAAVLDDILGVLALAFLYQFAVSGEISAASTARVGLFILLFMVLAPLAAKLMGLIFAQWGFANVILNAELYAALLIVISLTTLLPPFGLKWVYRRWRQPTAQAD